MNTRNVTALQRRFDAIALDQLRAEVVRLHEENNQLRENLHWAEDAAEYWREDALQMQEAACAATGSSPGITQAGTLVLVPKERAA